MSRSFLIVQAVVVVLLGIGAALRPADSSVELRRLAGIPAAPPDVPLTRTTPLELAPLADRDDLPEIVSEEELAYVLHRIRPRFDRKQMRPNLVEHALRTWSVQAEFGEPDVLSGEELAAFLTDHARFVQSWGTKEAELLQERPFGIEIRYGRTRSGSVHHDHWLASLTEAGVSLDTPVYGPGRRGDTIRDVLRESLYNFRLDERETEWTVMAFGLWLPPTHEWVGGEGRRYSFDLLARRLMRGDLEKGVCHGTHRVYSLVLLLRLDDEFPEVLSDGVREEVQRHLAGVRNAIAAAQFDDGHWPGNWPLGVEAREHPRDDKLSSLIIATGHHLEWQAIAPADLRLSDAQNRKAVEWLLGKLRSHSNAEVLQNYTFYTHVGNALALWRKTRPAPFWREWTTQHPEFVRETDATVPTDAAATAPASEEH